MDTFVLNDGKQDEYHFYFIAYIPFQDRICELDCLNKVKIFQKNLIKKLTILYLLRIQLIVVLYHKILNGFMMLHLLFNNVFKSKIFINISFIKLSLFYFKD